MDFQRLTFISKRMNKIQIIENYTKTNFLKQKSVDNLILQINNILEYFMLIYNCDRNSTII